MAIDGCEFLTHPEDRGRAIMGAMFDACPIERTRTQSYAGRDALLMLWGAGRASHARAWRAHVASGRHAVLWDLGYFGDRKSYARLSIDQWHPQAWIDRTPADPSRWQALNIPLRNDADEAGPAIVIGMGKKSREFLGIDDWEQRKAHELRDRFPGRKIIIRQKRDPIPIEQALQGASLVVCRHSNCAIDAVIAGVPFECEDGAAYWLQGKKYTTQARLDFLARLAWWQWKPSEAAQTWEFILRMTR